MNFFRWLLLHGFQLVICSRTAFAAAGEQDSNFDDMTSKEQKSFENFMDLNESFNYFHSHKIPLNTGSNDSSSYPYRYHGVEEHLIESLTKASSSAFHRSSKTSPIILYERPGHVFLDDELHCVCAEFRAMKSSVDPAAYSKQEKFEFLDKINDLGVFTNFESPIKGGNKKNQKIKEHLKFRGIFSSSIMSSHFCRDALRLIASVLNSSQITWLLENSIESIVCNSELLDQLEDFSIFSDYHVVKAFVDGHYDWFKNSKALRTLKPKALIALISELNYDLNFEQLALLNSARPIEELFETPEFYANPFVWQITAGTPHFRDEHMKIDDLTDLIESFEGDCSQRSLKGQLLDYTFIVKMV